MEKELQHYEIGFLLRNEEDAAGVVDLVKAHQGQIIQEPRIKRLKFAYPVEKEVSGYFGFMLFLAEPAQIKGLTAKLKLNKDVLRSMIFKVSAAAEDKEEGRGEKPQRHKETSEKSFKKAGPEIVDNELLEKKLEEILK